MADRIGQQLGNYKITAKLGAGGFAEVYLAEHIHLNTQAAIKVLPTQLTEEDIETFRTEARTVARLIHPQIVRVLEFGLEDKTPFLVMDYAPGGTLRQLYPKGTSLPLPAIVSYVKQVADALQYAHDANVIHRDVKPENMLVGRRAEILLSDFGVALMARSTLIQTKDEIVGTVYYMAPEQLQGKPHFASDQYALGIVVYEWLTGDQPFHGSFSEIVSQHLHVSPASPREKIPTLFPEIEDVILTALAKEPNRRFGNVRAFATALEEAVQASQRPSSSSVPHRLPQNQPEADALPSFSPPSVSLTVIDLSELSPITEPIGDQFQKKILPAGLPNSATEVSQDQDQPIPSSQRKSLSRRMMVAGLVTLGGLALMGGGIIWWEQSQSSPSQVLPQQKSVTSTPTIAVGTTLNTYRNHSGLVYTVAWSPDGKWIASGSRDRTVQIWNALDGAQVYIYHGHSSDISAVAWSPDGTRIASASTDKTVQVWDAVDGGHPYTYRGHSTGVSSLAWSRNGMRIASAGGSDKTVQVWDAVDGGHSYTYRGHGADVYVVSWSPDGKRIASAGLGQTVQVWDAVDGGHPYIYRGHSNEIYTVAWSPNSQMIASGGKDKTVQVWNAATGSIIYYRTMPDWTSVVAWSPNGKRIASGSGELQVWDAMDGKHTYVYRGHSSWVASIAWSPDGKRIASGSNDHTVQVWQAE